MSWKYGYPKRQKKKKLAKVTPPKPKKTKKKKIPEKFYQSWEWQELRFKILLRDGRQCACCGAKPPEVRVVVDHIKPRKKYPELQLDEGNMQVLCNSCNRGKSNKYETDFKATDLILETLEDDN